MMRADALRKVGPYSERYPHCEDYELFRRLVQHFRGGNLPEVLVHTEANPDGISIPKRRLQLFSRLRVQMSYFAWTAPRAYVGALRTVALILTPYSLLAWVKKRRGTVR